jgi:hypothetical protein
MTRLRLTVVALLIPYTLFCQGQAVRKGAHALSFGGASVWSKGLATLSASSLVTLFGRFDIGVSYGFLDYAGDLKTGNAVSASLTSYLVRRDTAGTYFALHASYASATSTATYTPNFGNRYTVEEHVYTPSIGLSLGATRGAIASDPDGVSILPSLLASLSFPDDAEGPVASYGFELAVLIPIAGPHSIVPSFAYFHSRSGGVGVDNLGLGIYYLLNLSA